MSKTWIPSRLVAREMQESIAFNSSNINAPHGWNKCWQSPKPGENAGKVVTDFQN